MGTGPRTNSRQRSDGAVVNLERVEEIAEAVLYEGYMLYPYRPSSVKNQQRWNFGVLCPQRYCERQPGSESSFMQTECLLRTSPSTRLTVKVRFLHIVQRLIRKCEPSGAAMIVDRLEMDGRTYQPWQEAVEQSFTCDALDPTSLAAGRTMQFSFPAGLQPKNCAICGMGSWRNRARTANALSDASSSCRTLPRRCHEDQAAGRKRQRIQCGHAG